MRLNDFSRPFAAGAIFACALAAAAHADMGKAPILQGTIVSLEGGYLLQDADGIIGHGIQPVDGAVHDVIVDPGNGWFAGGMIGFANRSAPSDLPFRRVEIYGLVGETHDSAPHTSPPLADITIKSADGAVFVSGPADGTVAAATSSHRRTSEIGLRFEDDRDMGAGHNLTWAVSPFIRWSDESTRTAVSQCCELLRSGAVDSVLFGVSFAVEPEWIIAPGVALAGRAGAGVYGYTADGRYRSSDNLDGFFASNFSDDDSGVGFRGQLGLSLKFVLSPTANLETFAEADYFSRLGTAVMANNDGEDATPSHTGTTDLWELRVGVRLTVGLGQ